VPDAWYLSRKPEGMKTAHCPKAIAPTMLKAHGPHEWMQGTHGPYWCVGLSVHPDTMIGGGRGRVGRPTE